MSTVKAVSPPANALLQSYVSTRAFTDCYLIQIEPTISFAAYVEAFYTTWCFKLERRILSLMGMPSTDDQAHELATGKRSTFAAWQLEAAASDQLLLSAGSTRSWLMLVSEPTSGKTLLYFGSAVVPGRNNTMAWPFKLLLGFHKLYSRLLLSAAAKRLCER